MAIELLTATSKKYYEDKAFIGKQIDEMLFPTVDNSLNTTVELDQYLGSPVALRAISPGGQAHVRQYTPGDGYQWTPPAFREKTPVDENLRDSVVAGVDPKSPAGQHLAQATRQIVSGPKGFIPAWKMTRAKAALNVYLTGKYTAKDEDNVVKEIDFERAGALTQTPNFGSVDQDTALKAMYDALAARGTPRGNLCVLMGSTWYKDWEEDSVVIEKRKLNDSMSKVSENMVPPLLQGVEGLYVVAKYHINGVAVPVWILTYEPDWPYLAKDGGSAEPFMPAASAIMFNLGGIGYRCNRGISVKTGPDKIDRVVGDLVFDNFVDDDPPVEWIRASARMMYLRGNINHTCVANGTGF